jgi:hypothetical protein
VSLCDSLLLGLLRAGACLTSFGLQKEKHWDFNKNFSLKQVLLAIEIVTHGRSGKIQSCLEALALVDSKIALADISHNLPRFAKSGLFPKFYFP